MSEPPPDPSLEHHVAEPEADQRPARRIAKVFALTAALTVAASLIWIVIFDVVGTNAAWALYCVLPWILTFVQLRNSRLWARILLASASVLTTAVVLIILVSIALST